MDYITNKQEIERQLATIADAYHRLTEEIDRVERLTGIGFCKPYARIAVAWGLAETGITHKGEIWHSESGDDYEDNIVYVDGMKFIQSKKIEEDKNE